MMPISWSVPSTLGGSKQKATNTNALPDLLSREATDLVAVESYLTTRATMTWSSSRVSVVTTIFNDIDSQVKSLSHKQCNVHDFHTFLTKATGLSLDSLISMTPLPTGWTAASKPNTVDWESLSLTTGNENSFTELLGYIFVYLASTGQLTPAPETMSDSRDRKSAASLAALLLLSVFLEQVVTLLVIRATSGTKQLELSYSTLVVQRAKNQLISLLQAPTISVGKQTPIAARKAKAATATTPVMTPEAVFESIGSAFGTLFKDVNLTAAFTRLAQLPAVHMAVSCIIQTVQPKSPALALAQAQPQQSVEVTTATDQLFAISKMRIGQVRFGVIQGIENSGIFLDTFQNHVKIRCFCPHYHIFADKRLHSLIQDDPVAQRKHAASERPSDTTSRVPFSPEVAMHFARKMYHLGDRVSFVVSAVETSFRPKPNAAVRVPKVFVSFSSHAFVQFDFPYASAFTQVIQTAIATAKSAIESATFSKLVLPFCPPRALDTSLSSPSVTDAVTEHVSFSAKSGSVVPGGTFYDEMYTPEQAERFAALTWGETLDLDAAIKAAAAVVSNDDASDNDIYSFATNNKYATHHHSCSPGLNNLLFTATKDTERTRTEQLINATYGNSEFSQIYLQSINLLRRLMSFQSLPPSLQRENSKERVIYSNQMQFDRIVATAEFFCDADRHSYLTKFGTKWSKQLEKQQRVKKLIFKAFYDLSRTAIVQTPTVTKQTSLVNTPKKLTVAGVKPQTPSGNTPTKAVAVVKSQTPSVNASKKGAAVVKPQTPSTITLEQPTVVQPQTPLLKTKKAPVAVNPQTPSVKAPKKIVKPQTPSPPSETVDVIVTDPISQVLPSAKRLIKTSTNVTPAKAKKATLETADSTVIATGDVGAITPIKLPAAVVKSIAKSVAKGTPPKSKKSAVDVTPDAMEDTIQPKPAAVAPTTNDDQVKKTPTSKKKNPATAPISVSKPLPSAPQQVAQAVTMTDAIAKTNSTPLPKSTKKIKAAKSELMTDTPVVAVPVAVSTSTETTKNPKLLSLKARKANKRSLAPAPEPTMEAVSPPMTAAAAAVPEKQPVTKRTKSNSSDAKASAKSASNPLIQMPAMPVQKPVAPSPRVTVQPQVVNISTDAVITLGELKTSIKARKAATMAVLTASIQSAPVPVETTPVTINNVVPKTPKQPVKLTAPFTPQQPTVVTPKPLKHAAPMTPKQPLKSAAPSTPIVVPQKPQSALQKQVVVADASKIVEKSSKKTQNGQIVAPTSSVAPVPMTTPSKPKAAASKSKTTAPALNTQSAPAQTLRVAVSKQKETPKPRKQRATAQDMSDSDLFSPNSSPL